MTTNCGLIPAVHHFMECFLFEYNRNPSHKSVVGVSSLNIDRIWPKIGNIIRTFCA